MICIWAWSIDTLTFVSMLCEKLCIGMGALVALLMSCECLRSGFYDTYFVLRDFIHRTLRAELSTSPGQVIFTGHSLGGALATFAALDFSVHSLSRINKYIRHRKLYV